MMKKGILKKKLQIYIILLVVSFNDIFKVSAVFTNELEGDLVQVSLDTDRPGSVKDYYEFQPKSRSESDLESRTMTSSLEILDLESVENDENSTLQKNNSTNSDFTVETTLPGILRVPSKVSIQKLKFGESMKSLLTRKKLTTSKRFHRTKITNNYTYENVNFNLNSNTDYEATLATDFGNLSTNSNYTTGEALFIDRWIADVGEIPVLNRKVFKARRVSIAEHPYVVSIRRNYSHFLVGSMLKKNIFITVAHPVYHVPIYELGVVMGENYNERGTTLQTVVLLLIHTKFNPFSLLNDLALLRTYEEITFTSNIQFIPLNKNGSVHGNTAFVTGWGRCDFTDGELCLPRSSVYYPDEIMDPMLRTISFPVDENTFDCRDYKKLGTRVHLKKMCVGTARKEDSMAPCLGVPGAPLVVKGELLGVLSSGLGCGYTRDLPLIYLDLRKYQRWLKTNTRVLTSLSMKNLTQLFKATRAYLLSALTYSTRINKQVKKLLHEREQFRQIEMTDIDDVLVGLRGKVYDIRDFVHEGRFHISKKEQYRTLKEKLLVAYLDGASGLSTTTTEASDYDSYNEDYETKIQENSTEDDF